MKRRCGFTDARITGSAHAESRPILSDSASESTADCVDGTETAEEGREQCRSNSLRSTNSAKGLGFGGTAASSTEQELGWGAKPWIDELRQGGAAQDAALPIAAREKLFIEKKENAEDGAAHADAERGPSAVGDKRGSPEDWIGHCALGGFGKNTVSLSCIHTSVSLHESRAATVAIYKNAINNKVCISTESKGTLLSNNPACCFRFAMRMSMGSDTARRTMHVQPNSRSVSRTCCDTSPSVG